MKTIIKTKRFFTKRIQSFATILVTIVAFTACSEQTTIEELGLEDAVLIEKIESASKITVDAAALPTATKATFNDELADSFIQNVQLAKGLGYKVSLYTDNESRVEATSTVFFSMSGKQLNDQDQKRGFRRNKCFEFVFPVDFIMPDDSAITLETKADWVLIREWYKANPGVKVRPELLFPVDIQLEDGTIQTLLDRSELMAVKDACKMNRDKRKCFKFELPVTFTMPDASEIIVNERADFRLIRQWHIANPTVNEKASLNFPVTIIYKDASTAIITDEAALIAAKVACRN
ncbi:hypothetical protein [Polaribacter sp.]|uniref:hypothetical protein n=2 Tax=Polaribacter sp. TaxID=1920175 RepID=UPI0040473E5C